MDISQAIVEAEELNAKAAVEGLDLVYLDLEGRMTAFEDAGYPIDSVVPSDHAEGLGFALRTKDGKAFFDIYADLLRTRLCSGGGKFNQLIKDGISAGVGSILTIIAGVLAIPAVALGLLIPIAVIIAHTGLEAFCKVTEPDQT